MKSKSNKTKKEDINHEIDKKDYLRFTENFKFDQNTINNFVFI